MTDLEKKFFMDTIGDMLEVLYWQTYYQAELGRLYHCQSLGESDKSLLALQSITRPIVTLIYNIHKVYGKNCVPEIRFESVVLEILEKTSLADIESRAAKLLDYAFTEI